MRSVDVAVVGVGVMGAATLAALARRGVSAVGIERFDVPHARGSSHGGTRVIRKAYYEDPGYVPLLQRAWEAWRALERDQGETIQIETGALHFGPAVDPDVQAVIRAADRHGLPYERLGATALTRRYDQFRLADGDIAVLEKDAGVLLVDRALSALARTARQRGATIMAREPLTRLEITARGVELTTANRVISARRAVLTLGPWWPSHAPIAPPLELSVTRQMQLWFQPRRPERFDPERFPVFMRYGQGQLIYGLPEAAYPGLKIASHAYGALADPETLMRDPGPDDVVPIRRFLSRHLPGADGPLLGARACMYTVTRDGHFALGVHPEAPAVIVGAGFSGHGFKLAPVVGEILADLALDGESPLMLPLFALDRARSPGPS